MRNIQLMSNKKVKRFWINNDVEQKMWVEESTIPEGWKKDRLPVTEETKQNLKAAKQNLVHVHNNSESRIIHIEELQLYLDMGYERGRGNLSEEGLKNIQESRRRFFDENPHWVGPTSWKKGRETWNKGLPMSDEAKQKLSEKKQGLTLSEEAKQQKKLNEINTRIQNSGSLEESYKQAQQKRSDTISKLIEDNSNYIQDIVKKGFKTKMLNGTYQSSKPEELFYSRLLEIFDEQDIIRQYLDKGRYPYHCDFYIKSLDLFIELNLTWFHGGHPFNKDSEEDIARLNHLMSKQAYYISSKTGKVKKNSYFDAVKCWTQRDPAKLQLAIQNNLNYIVIYKETEIDDFFERIQIKTSK